MAKHRTLLIAPEKNMWSHVMNALEHGLSAIAKRAKREQRTQQSAQMPPRTLVGETERGYDRY